LFVKQLGLFYCNQAIDVLIGNVISFPEERT